MLRVIPSSTLVPTLLSESPWARSYSLHTVVNEGDWAVGKPSGAATNVQRQAESDSHAKQLALTIRGDFDLVGGDLNMICEAASSGQ